MDDRTFIEWDKDDVDALHMMKVDVLALGMLTCIRKCFDLIDASQGRALEARDHPAGRCKRVYDMLCQGESLGVFQVESRAQMNMLPRLKPRTFYDLVIEVAIVRPGPIQGDMVHPYLRRRNGLEKVSYPSPSPEHGDKDELLQGAAQDARRAAVPGAGDADRDRGGEIHRRRGQRAAPRDGDLSQCRHHRQIRGQDDRQHDRARLRSGISPKAVSTRSRDSAPTAFRKAMPRALPSSSISRHG